MKTPSKSHEVTSLAAAARSLKDDCGDLVAKAAQADFVLIGEATHGTREFYEWRARITRQLVEKHDFRVIAIEADWPDALRVHRYCRGAVEEPTALDSLGNFQRFRRWMWRNETMPPFIDWLRQWNRPLMSGQTGIFGMDLYSLHSSIHEVLTYLESVDRSAAARARERYSCFDHYGSDPEVYGYLTERDGGDSCSEKVISQLLELTKMSGKIPPANDPDELFYAGQNAKVIANAEGYYRAMFRRRDDSWNLRDSHMEETVRDLSRHYQLAGQDAKVIVWAHNSHTGNASATSMGERDQWNLGQLLRQRLGRQVYAIGFSTYGGFVTAADHWNGTPRRMRVNPALPGSYEALFHELGKESFWLDLRDDPTVARVLREPRLERAIGVIYRPSTERASHYFTAKLTNQFDAIIHIDQTDSIKPLDDTAQPALDRPAADMASRF